jgi:sRNA-binding protein
VPIILPPLQLLPTAVQSPVKAYKDHAERIELIGARCGELDSDRAHAARKAADAELQHQARPEDIGSIGTPNQDQAEDEIRALKQAFKDETVRLAERQHELGLLFLEQKAALLESASKAPQVAADKLRKMVEAYIAQRGAFEQGLNYRGWAGSISERVPVPGFAGTDEQTTYGEELFGGIMGMSADDLHKALLNDAGRFDALAAREAKQAAEDAKNARARARGEELYASVKAAEAADGARQAEQRLATHRALRLAAATERSLNPVGETETVALS